MYRAKGGIAITSDRLPFQQHLTPETGTVLTHVCCSTVSKPGNSMNAGAQPAELPISPNYLLLSALVFTKLWSCFQSFVFYSSTDHFNGSISRMLISLRYRCSSSFIRASSVVNLYRRGRKMLFMPIKLLLRLDPVEGALFQSGWTFLEVRAVSLRCGVFLI